MYMERTQRKTKIGESICAFSAVLPCMVELRQSIQK